MSTLIGETTRLLGRHRAGDHRAGDDLIAHACARLRRLARKMLRADFARLRRWEQTDDVLQNALLRLHRALTAATPVTSDHFWNLAARQIRRELLDLIRHHTGPQADAAHHHTDRPGAADPEGAMARQAAGGEPSSAAEWQEFLELIEGLPGEQREVFDLYWVQGLKQEEVAAALGVSLRTVKRRWHSALLSLGQALAAG